jgi:hypothetical protein
MRTGKIRAKPLTGRQLMRLDQGAAIAPSSAREPAERTFCFIDNHVGPAVIGDDLPLRQDEMLSAKGPNNRLLRS